MCSFAFKTAFWYSLLVIVEFFNLEPKRPVCKLIDPAASLGLKLICQIYLVIATTTKTTTWPIKNEVDNLRHYIVHPRHKSFQPVHSIIIGRFNWRKTIQLHPVYDICFLIFKNRKRSKSKLLNTLIAAIIINLATLMFLKQRQKWNFDYWKILYYFIKKSTKVILNGEILSKI